MYPMECLHDHICFADSRCGIQGLWADVDIAVRKVFEQTTVGHLADRHRKLAEPPMWAASELIRPRG